MATRDGRGKICVTSFNSQTLKTPCFSGEISSNRPYNEFQTGKFFFTFIDFDGRPYNQTLTR